MVFHLAPRMIWLILSLQIIVCMSYGQSKKYELEGDGFYNRQMYEEALNAYQSALNGNQKNDELILKLGLTLYSLNDLKSAEKYFSTLINKGSRMANQAQFYLARVYQNQNAFEKAIDAYKDYLRKSEENDLIRRAVKAEIIRCSNGILHSEKSDVFVENMGSEINDVYDDFGPFQSPNNPDKIYFSSIRRTNTGGLRNESGIADHDLGTYTSDIYMAEKVSGNWNEARSLTALINGPLHDVLWGFNGSGQVMYYFKGYNLYSGEIVADTFKTMAERTLEQRNYLSALNTPHGDGQPFFFNDSTVLYSSDGKGGFGGRDLYISIRQNGKWSDPQNMGADINTPFEEDFAYLAPNGETLFFSSNRLESMGGYDIFSSQFDAQSGKWSIPANLGSPLNSAADDTWFKPTFDGTKAYFSSNRKMGWGGHDIYVAYFTEQVVSPDQRTTQLPFMDSIKKSNNDAPDSEVVGFTMPPQEEHIALKPLYYEADGNVLTILNMAELEKHAELLESNPSFRLQLVGFSDGSDPSQHELFFGLRRLLRASQFLEDQGIAPSRVYLLSAGSQYPMLNKNGANVEPSIIDKYSRRIDLRLIDSTSNSEISNSTKAHPPFDAKTRNSNLMFFNNMLTGLSYRVMLASTSQSFEHEVITSYPDVLAEWDQETEKYVYTAGLYKSFASAKELKKQLAEEELENLSIQAYMNGLPVDVSQLENLSLKYSDLFFYREYLEK